MSRFWKVFLLILAILVVIFVISQIVNQDDSPSATTEEHRTALADWHSVSPEVQELVCNIFRATGRDDYVFIDTTMSDSEKEIKLDIFEQECT